MWPISRGCPRVPQSCSTAPFIAMVRPSLVAVVERHQAFVVELAKRHLEEVIAAVIGAHAVPREPPQFADAQTGAAHQVQTEGDGRVRMLESLLQLQGRRPAAAAAADSRASSAGRLGAAGAKAMMAVQGMFWGARYGKLVDPYGHEWGINQQVKHLTAAEEAEQAKLFFSKK